jgi:hypothetical protein
MSHDFLDFLLALWAEWRVLLTGGTIFAAVSVWSLATSKPLPPQIDWLVLEITLILASFLAWRKEWIASNGHALSVEPKRLLELRSQGSQLQSDALLAPYMGKRITITSTLTDISNNIASFESDGVRACSFELLWRPFTRSIIPLPIGSVVTMNGRNQGCGYILYMAARVQAYQG